MAPTARWSSASSEPRIPRRRRGDRAHLLELPGRADLLALARRRPDRYPVLLESTGPLGGPGRYSILLGFPGEQLLARAGEAGPRGWLQALDRVWAAERSPPDPALGWLPFRGGWFLYLGYELAGEIEPRLRLPPAGGGLPTAVALRVPAAMVVDHRRRRSFLVAEPGHGAKLEVMRRDLRHGAGVPRGAGAGPLVEALQEEEGERYLAAVQRALGYIRDGDVFQANLSRLWRARLRPGVEAGALYARLRRANPAPFSALARLGRHAIVSSSPERLLRRQGALVQTRPIAGTRARVSQREQDARGPGALLATPKERAEHVMLIDLERNDLGRVCRPGTIRVDELMRVESYAAVHHIVSNVRGELRPGITPGQLLAAVFPGGTITGCPKVRCMEIIAELEGVGRGAYTGSLGYLNRDGSLDLNILIRSFVQVGDALEFRAGAGIVADSRPEAELAETRAKARALLRALGTPGP